MTVSNFFTPVGAWANYPSNRGRADTGTDYNSYIGEQGTPFVESYAGYTSPLFAWVPSIAPTQLIEVTNCYRRWNGDLLVATLKALSLYRV